MIETKSHRIAFDTLVTLGTLFYSGARPLPRIKPRYSGLVVGATGSGKSFLVERVAKQLGATYQKFTRGDWLPQGVRTGRPTLYQILDCVATHDRVLLHIDELDKFQIDFRSHDWGSSIASDLWSILEYSAPIAEYLRDTPFTGGAKPDAKTVQADLNTRLFIVGSGTWQETFEEKRAGASIGFVGRAQAATVTKESIATARLISPELLCRFNSDMIFLEYPTLEETATLLEETGIRELAKELGMVIRPEEIVWHQAGLRAIETVATRLIVLRYQRERERLRAKVVAKDAAQRARDHGPRPHP